MSTQTGPGTLRKRRHWGWISFLFFSGALLTFTSFWTDSLVGLGGIDWLWIEASELPVVQSILTNLGTGFMSTAVLFLFEPLLWKVVRKTANDVFEINFHDIETRVGSLEERLSQDITASINRQDSAVDAARIDFSYAAISELMDAALQLDCILERQITVQATDKPGEFEFSIGYPSPGEKSEPAETSILRVMVSTEATDCAAVETWQPEEPFEAVAQRLHDELVRKGISGKAELPPWTTAITRTVETLETALKASRVRSGQRKPGGKIAEIIGGHWAITDQGIESLSHEYQVPRAIFPHMHSPYSNPDAGGFYEGPLVAPDIDKPEWVEADEWQYLITRASKRFTRVKSFGRWHASPVMIPYSDNDTSP